MDFSASETLRPSMQIKAYTPHRGGEGERTTSTCILSWPYDKMEPQIPLSYDEPGYSESEIWRMLGGTSSRAGWPRTRWSARSTRRWRAVSRSTSNRARTRHRRDRVARGTGDGHRGREVPVGGHLSAVPARPVDGEPAGSQRGIPLEQQAFAAIAAHLQLAPEPGGNHGAEYGRIQPRPQVSLGVLGTRIACPYPLALLIIKGVRPLEAAALQPAEA